MIYDCAIVGGGPAGLNAALVLGRTRRNVALLDNNHPRNAVTHASHNYLTRDGVTPAEFRRLAYEEVLRYPSVHQLKTEVDSITRLDSGFEVLDSSGIRIQARKLILATGLKEIFPEIDGLHSYYGKSLFNCPFCDGWELQDQPLVVVSKDPSVFHTAKLLFNWTRDLIVCTNGQDPLSAEQKEQLLSKGIAVMEQPVAAFLGENGQLSHVRFADGTTIARTGGFVAPTFIQGAPFIESLDCEKTPLGGIKTDELGKTSIPGLFAAGDASYLAPSQLVYAAASGNKAATSVTKELTEEDFYDKW